MHANIEVPMQKREQQLAVEIDNIRGKCTAARDRWRKARELRHRLLLQASVSSQAAASAGGACPDMPRAQSTESSSQTYVKSTTSAAEIGWQLDSVRDQPSCSITTCTPYSRGRPGCTSYSSQNGAAEQPPAQRSRQPKTAAAQQPSGGADQSSQRLCSGEAAVQAPPLSSQALLQLLPQNSRLPQQMPPR